LEPDLLAIAWELARIPSGMEPSMSRDLALLALLLLVVQAQGSTRVSLDGSDLRELLLDFERPHLDLKKLLADPRLAPLVGKAGETKPFVLEDGWLSSGRMRCVENRLAVRIRARLQSCGVKAAVVPEAIMDAPVLLSEEQRQAVSWATSRSLTLVTGGPGTGKTSIVLSILRAMLCHEGWRPCDIALAAPTGKAAYRLREAVRGTLARLSEWKSVY
jgi:exodeoxyribonuclease V alpha subunit